MAKPRVFISSTYYDLRHIRKGIELFVEQLGYEAILFESGDIPFSHDSPLDESCYREIGTSHILVLIIGGRFGSQTSDSNVEISKEQLERHYQHYNSITQRELETALSEDIPVYIFVEKGVASEYGTFKENRDNESIRYAHVDSVNIFRLLDFIYARKRNNLTREFENLEDITLWLRDQWAGLLAEFLMRRAKERPLQSLQLQLTNLKNVTETLKSYSESIIRGISPERAEQIIHDTDAKLHEQVARDIFRRHDLINHLIEDHGADLDIIINAFRTSRTTGELIKNIENGSNKGVHCEMFRHMIMEDSNNSELLILRDVLGLPPLKQSHPEELWEPRRRKKPRESSAE